jgi:hypothetical protein
MSAVKASFLSEIGDTTPRELTADQLDVVSGAKYDDHPHYFLNFGPATLELCLGRGCYSLYNGGEEVSSTC